MLLPGFMLDAELWGDIAGTLSERHKLFHGDLAEHDTIDEMGNACWRRRLNASC